MLMAACEATGVVNNMVARGQHPGTLFTWTIIGGPLNPSHTRYLVIYVWIFVSPTIQEGF